MNSVLTNTGAMTALQVLNQANKNMGITQGRISTGLKVASADQNAAVYAMAGTMKADVAGYQTIQEGLSVAESAVSVGRSAAEAMGTILQEIKDKIVAAQDGNQNRATLQADIDQYKEQIRQIASSASFNGINYLKGSDGVDVLSSLNRSTEDGANYQVNSSVIDFSKQNLAIGATAANAVTVVSEGSEKEVTSPSIVDLDLALDATAASNGNLYIKIGGRDVDTDGDLTDGVATGIDLTAFDSSSDLGSVATAIQSSLQSQFGTDVTVSVVDGKIRITDAQARGISDVSTDGAGTLTPTEVNAGSIKNAVTTEVNYTFDKFQGDGELAADEHFSGVALVRTDGTKIAIRGEDAAALQAAATMDDFATALQAALNKADDEADPNLDNTDADSTNDAAAYTVTWDKTSGKLTVEDSVGRGVALRFESDEAGKLGSLNTLDVTTETGAKAALDDIETLIQDTLSASAALGSTQKRITVQKDFLSKLTDALTTGIGTLVDADMTQESARMQSLQVQQQLATQALGIANQQPQNLLSLFRG
jgi:flagellin